MERGDPQRVPAHGGDSRAAREKLAHGILMAKEGGEAEREHPVG